MKPLMIAHRGDTVNFPENTIDAFKSAFEKGAGGIEFDVQLNEQKELIIVHDYQFDKNKKYPLFEDVLKQFGQKGRLEIEIKSLEVECVKKIKELIDVYKPKDFEITSSVYALMPYIKQEFPNTKIGLIHLHKLFEDWMTTEFKNEFILKYLNLCGANILHLGINFFSKDLVELLHKNNLFAHSHLKTNGLEEYQKVLNLKIDQLTFDDINLLKKI